jgi:nitrite reductase/ring-hydroxylating ferredoxin subunit
MDAYFSFLRANGASLDPKTRALISIITKVANQTESGLKQYALKALRDGVSTDEVLDAILMAFPALGLSKTVWAVDVLIECGVLGSDIKDAADGKSWHDIRDLSNSPQGITVSESDGRYVFAVCRDDQWHVFDARCPHSGTSLAFCPITRSTIECPSHGWTFDLNTGTCTRYGTKNLVEFESRISGQQLQAYW